MRSGGAFKRILKSKAEPPGGEGVFDPESENHRYV